MPRLGSAAGALLLAFLGPVSPALVSSDEAPAGSPGPRALESSRHNLLAEMWQRRILSPEADRWAPEDMALLERIRRAEASQAASFLKSRLGTLKGLAVSRKLPGGAIRLRLTKEGFERYLLIRSQEALRVFESKGVDAKWAFSLRDLEDRRLFEPRGLLSEAGEALYDRILAGLAAHWKTPAGEVFGNRPPPKREAPAEASLPGIPTPRPKPTTQVPPATAKPVGIEP